MTCRKKRGVQIKIIMCLLAVCLFFSACSGQAQKKGATYVLLTRDGEVKSYISESFEQNYYDGEELQQVILSRVAAYNRMADAGSIAVDKVKVKGNRAIVEMTYRKPADYAEFNRNVFFAGTPKEAQEAGYQTNVVLSSVRDSLETIGQADILGMENVKLLITDVREPIRLSGKALYIGEQTAVLDNDKTVGYKEDGTGMLYVVYQ